MRGQKTKPFRHRWWTITFPDGSVKTEFRKDRVKRVLRKVPTTVIKRVEVY